MNYVWVLGIETIEEKMKLEDIKKFMNDNTVVIDTRGMFDEEAMKETFYYKAL